MQAEGKHLRAGQVESFLPGTESSICRAVNLHHVFRKIELRREKPQTEAMARHRWIPFSSTLSFFSQCSLLVVVPTCSQGVVAVLDRLESDVVANLGTVRSKDWSACMLCFCLCKEYSFLCSRVNDASRRRHSVPSHFNSLLKIRKQKRRPRQEFCASLIRTC